MADLGELKVKVSADMTGLKSAMTDAGVATNNFAKTEIANFQKLGAGVQSFAANAQAQLAIYKRGLKVATDQRDITRYTAGIKSIELQLADMGKVGKTSFQELSDSTVDATGKISLFQRSLSKATSPDALGARAVSRISRSVVGLGAGFLIGGVVSAVGPFIEAIDEYIASLNKASEAEKTAKANLQNLNDVMADANKKAGEQTADLKILYAAATNVNLSMKDRLAAVKTLKTEFPDYFKSVDTEIILNGKAKKSYDDLVLSIQASSRAKAAKDKIDALEAQRLDNEFTKAKIIGTTDAEKARVRASTQKFSEFQGTADEFVLSRTVAGQRKIIEARKLGALQQVDLNNKSLQDQEDFLIKFAGLANVAKAVEDQNKPGKTKKEIESIAGDLEKLRNTLSRITEENKKNSFLNPEKEKQSATEIESVIKHLMDKFKLTIDNPVIKALENERGLNIAMEHLKAELKASFAQPIPLPFEIVFDNIRAAQDPLGKVISEFKNSFKEGLDENDFKEFSKAVDNFLLSLKPGDNVLEGLKAIKEFFKEPLIDTQKGGVVFTNLLPPDVLKRAAETGRLVSAGFSKNFLQGLSEEDFAAIYKEFSNLATSIADVITDVLAPVFQSFFTDITEGSSKAFSDFGSQLAKALKQLTATLLKVAALDTLFTLISGGTSKFGAAFLKNLPRFLHFADGGLVKGFAGGGAINGPGTGKSDSILARLSHGEFIIQSDIVKKYGVDFFDKINSGIIPKFAGGGLVTPQIISIPSVIPNQIPSVNIGGGNNVQVFIPEVKWRGADMVVGFKKATDQFNLNN